VSSAGSSFPRRLAAVSGLGGKGLGKSTAKRHRNVLRAGCSGALLA